MPQLFGWLVDFENLVGPNGAQHLDYATWPANLNAIDLVELASSEVDASRTGGSIAHCRGHVVELIAQLDSCADPVAIDRKSTRLNSSHRCISYAVFCLKTKTTVPQTAEHH